MLFISLLILIVAIPLYTYRISPYTYVRITTIILIYSAFLTFNRFYLESIKSGISIYSGLFQVTTISQRTEIFIYIIGSLILFGWRIDSYKNKSYSDVSQVIRYNLNSSPSNDEKNNNINYYPKIDVSYFKSSFVPRYNEFSLMIIFTTIGASFLISSSDLVSIYLSIELQSFAVYILATLYRNSESATAAGLKYFLLGGLSSAIILLGTGIIYSNRGITQIEGIFNLLRSSIRVNFEDNTINRISYSINGQESSSILFGIVLISIGFLFKVAAAPFHSWAPDVYDGVPTIITSWITTMPKISIFILLLDIHSGIESIPNVSSFMNYLSRTGINNIDYIIGDYTNNNSIESTNTIWNITIRNQEVFKNLLLISSILSLLIGTIVGLSQFRIKRLLAFSTISHVGFILLALAIFTEESISSFLFYIIQYSITNVNVFLILLAFSYAIHSTTASNDKGSIDRFSKKNMPFGQKNDIEFIEELKGQFYSNPLLSIRFAISLFSMAGIPPLVGFFAKQMVLYSSIHNGYYFISIVAILVSVISASYYLKIIQIMYFRPKSNNTKNNDNIDIITQKGAIQDENINYSISNLHSLIISAITMFITLFMIHPSIVTNISEILRLSIFNC